MRINIDTRVIMTAAAAALLAACGPENPPAAAEPSPADGETVAAVVKAEKPAAPGEYVKRDTYFSVPSLDGGNLDLASYAGKPVLLMLFTETCPYCRKAAPALQRLHEEFSGKGLSVLGLCIQEPPEPARNFRQDHALAFPVGYAARSVYKQYRAQGVPFIFLLDRQHKVAGVWPGYAEEFDAQMADAVRKALRS